MEQFTVMEKIYNYLKDKYKILIEYLVTEYLFYFKGFEDGPRIERRMLKYQHEFDKWCRKRGIALVAFKNKDETIALSFVKEEMWDEQKDKVQQEIMDELLKEKGDEIKEKPKKKLSIDEEVEKILNG